MANTNDEGPLNPPFTVGEVWWLPSHAPNKITVPCPVCAGQRRVTLILGDGEHVSLHCDGCGIGFDGPRGVIEEYSYEPQVVPFPIASIVRFDSDSDRYRWTVRSDTGATADFSDLCMTESEAMAVASANALAQEERNMETRQRKKKNARGGWTVRYHREQIKDLERQLAWHSDKVQTMERAK